MRGELAKARIKKTTRTILDIAFFPFAIFYRIAKNFSKKQTPYAIRIENRRRRRKQFFESLEKFKKQLKDGLYYIYDLFLWFGRLLTWLPKFIKRKLTRKQSVDESFDGGKNDYSKRVIQSGNLFQRTPVWIKISAVILVIAAVIIAPQFSNAAQTFSASYNSSSLNADFAAGSTTASNDGTPASLVSGYGLTGQAANIASGQTLKYATSNNLSVDKGSISAMVKSNSLLNGDFQTGKFSGPGGVFYDSASEYLYISDSNNNRIIKTKFDGTGWTSFGTYGQDTNNFYNPQAIYYDSASGYLYIADRGNHRIVKTKMDGSGWTVLGGPNYSSNSLYFNYPTGIYYDSSSDYIYVADAQNSRIVKTKIDGAGWTAYGSYGSTAGKFSGPVSISYDPATSYIYVLDGNNNRLVKTQIDGTGWTTYGSQGTGTGNFYNNGNAAQIWYDAASSYVYVADYYNNRIVKTQIDGTGWTVYKPTADPFYYPRGIYYDSISSNIYMTDASNGRIVKTQIDGTGRSHFGSSATSSLGLNAPRDVDYDPATGYMYIIDSNNGRIVKTKSDGTGWTSLGRTGGQTQQFSSPYGIDYDPASEYIYVADKSNNRIVKTKMDGSGWTSLGGFNNPSGLSYDSSTGYIYVSDTSNNRIVKTKMDGSGWATFGSAGFGVNQFTGPTELQYDPGSGYLYVADTGSGRVVKTKFDGTGWTALGAGYTSSVSSKEGLLYTPTNIYYDASSENLYISTGLKCVVRTKIDGTGWTTYGSCTNGSDYYQFGNGRFQNPAGLYYDSGSGTLMVSDYTSSDITFIQDSNVTSLSEGIRGGTVKQFAYPTGVQYDAGSGFVYIADSENDRVVKMKPDGSEWSSFGTHYYSPDTAHPGGFNNIKDIFYDPGSGYIYAVGSADNSYSRIYKFKFDGTGWVVYGADGTGTGQLRSPTSIYYDAASDYIYVADSGNSRIVKTKINGTGWTTYGTNGTGVGNFNVPKGIFYDPASTYIYIADTSNNRIVKTQIDGTGWTTYGSNGSEYGKFNAPNDIFYDAASSYLYVADSNNHRVVKTQIDGTGWKSCFKNYGKLDGGLNTPRGIWFDSGTGKTFIGDGENHRIVTIDSFGGVWSSYGTNGSGTGNFNSPSDVYYDSSSEYLYIADTSNNRIVKTKIDGTGWTSYGSAGTGTGKFQNPKGIYYDSSSEYLYITDTTNHRIVKTKIDGTGWTSYGSSGSGTGKFSSPNRVVYDSTSQYLYVSDTANNRIVKTKIDGTGWTSYGSSGSGIGNFSSPIGIYYHSVSDYLYICDSNNNRIVKTKIDGTGWQTAVGGSNSVGEFGLNSPDGIFYDSATDFVYVSSANGSTVIRMKMDGSYWYQYGGSTSAMEGYWYPKGLFYDTASGYLYVSDFGNNRISKVQMGADNLHTIGSSYNSVGYLNQPNAVHYDSASGYLFIADMSNHRIVKTKIDGTGWTVLGGVTNGTTSARFYNPQGIYYDSSTEFIYVSDTYNNRIVKTKIDGSGWTTYGGSGSGSGQFNNPKGIVYDSSTGYLYIADRQNNRIVKTQIDGTGWTAYGTNGSGVGNFSGPKDLDYDSSSGYLYVADSGNNRIVKTQIDGTGWATYGSSGSCNSLTNCVGKFDGLSSVDYDASTGFIYTIDSGNSRIAKFKIDGTGWSDQYYFRSTTDIFYDSASGDCYTTGLRMYNGPYGVLKFKMTSQVYKLYGNKQVLVQSQGDGLRMELDPISSRLTFYPAYNVDRSIYVQSDPLLWQELDWHDIKAWYNQPDGQLKLSIDGTEYVGTGSWSLPSYGDSFYVGSNTSGTETLGGAVDNLKLIDIYTDSDMPTNPSTVHGYSNTGKGTTVSDNSWYNYQQTGPYFEWSGAADIGSGISGYYVYFGTNSSANPVTSGTWQTVENYQNTASLSSGSTYYLRVAAKDNDVHTASGTTLFTYKFDNTSPSAPDHITSDPLGCSFSEPYTLTWPAVTDSESQTAGYDYKNGSDGTVQQTSNLSAQVNHYQEGANYFYARTRDNAGNTSAWQSTSYCYALDNTPPTNPTATTGLDSDGGSTQLTTDTWYNYAHPKFSWSGAADNVSVDGYYVYFGTSSSADPEVSGSYQTGTSYIVPGTLVDDTTYYLRIKAKDIANIPATTTYQGFIYKYSTSVPTNPTTLTAKDQSTGTNTITTATWYNYENPYFEWSGASGGKGIAGYYVYFGTNSSADPQSDGTYQAAANYTADNLDSGSTYYLRVRARDNAGNPAGGTWAPFSYKYDGTAPEPPEYISTTPQGCSISPTFDFSWPAVTDSQSGLKEYDYKVGSQGSVIAETDTAVTIAPYQEGDNILYVRARDNAGNSSSWQTIVFCAIGTVHITDGPNIIPAATSITVNWVTDKMATSYVSVRDGNTYVSGQGFNVYSTAHSVQVIGLKASHGYQYQLSWSDQSGNLGSSTWYEVQTAEPPVVKNIRSQILLPTSVIISYSTSVASDTTLEYGTSSLSSSINVGKGTDFTVPVNSLSAGEVYQFRIKAVSSIDSFEFFGQDTFVTPPLPAITDIRFEPDTTSSLFGEKVTWVTNVETSSSIFYGIVDQSKKEISTVEKVKLHSVVIPDLLDNSEYEVVISGSDVFGNTTTSQSQRFKTPIDVRPPTVSSITIETSNVGNSQQDKAQIVVSWKTDKLATSQVEYGEGISGSDYKFRSNEDSTMTNSHVVVISDLEPNRPYHLRVVSKDKNGNIGVSGDNAVVSGEVQESVFTTIMKTFSTIFGWMSFFK